MGGGFCDKHGPYDPPHTSCPFCAREEAERRAYGRPSGAEATRPSSQRVPDHNLEQDEAEFVRETVDASPPTKDDITQIAPSHLLSEDASEEPSWLEDKPEPLAWMIVKWPAEQRGEVVPVRANQIIGRHGDIRWDDPRLSRQHARFTFEPAQEAPDAGPVFHLWPFGPTNPVAVNGQMIRGATPVHENDEIHLGDTLFVFKVLFD